MPLNGKTFEFPVKIFIECFIWTPRGNKRGGGRLENRVDKEGQVYIFSERGVSVTITPLPLRGKLFVSH